MTNSDGYTDDVDKAQQRKFISGWSKQSVQVRDRKQSIISTQTKQSRTLQKQFLFSIHQ